MTERLSQIAFVLLSLAATVLLLTGTRGVVGQRREPLARPFRRAGSCPGSGSYRTEGNMGALFAFCAWLKR